MEPATFLFTMRTSNSVSHIGQHTTAALTILQNPPILTLHRNWVLGTVNTPKATASFVTMDPSILTLH